jgi:N4-gp56 family major capsid protein
MGQTSSSINNNQLSGYWVDRALQTLINETVLYPHAMKTPLTGGKGLTVHWNSWNRLAGASSTLTQGGSNTPVALSSRTVTATIDQYGRGIQITDLAQYANVLNTREGAQQRLRDSAKETQEWILHTAIFKSTYYTQNQSSTIILSAMMSGLASSFCANTGTNTNSNKQFQFPAVFGASVGRLSAVSKTAPSVSAKASLKAISKAVLRLKQKNAPRFADGYYIGYAHVNFFHILRRDPAFLEWNKAQNAKETMYVGEVAQTEGVRWLESNLCPRYGVTAHSVNITFIFGQESFGITEALGGLEMYLIDTPDHTNPYNTYADLTYKITAAAATLNPSAGVLLFTEELL